MFFFFQAEDGIRDLTVTGVQTCALPISTLGRAPRNDDGVPGRAPERGQGIDDAEFRSFVGAGRDEKAGRGRLLLSAGEHGCIGGRRAPGRTRPESSGGPPPRRAAPLPPRPPPAPTPSP